MKKFALNLTALLVTAGLLIGVAAFTGCDETSYHKALKASAAISSGLKALQAENESLYHAGVVAPSEAVAIARLVDNAAVTNTEFRKQLQAIGKLDTAANRVAIAAAVQELTKSLDTLNVEGVLHIKNADSQAKLAAVFAAIRASIEILKVLLSEDALHAPQVVAAGIVPAGAMGMALIIQLALQGLAIFAKLVTELKTQGQLTDEQLAAFADQQDAETRDAVKKFIGEVKPAQPPAGGIAGAGQ